MAQLELVCRACPLSFLCAANQCVTVQECCMCHKLFFGAKEGRVGSFEGELVADMRGVNNPVDVCLYPWDQIPDDCEIKLRVKNAAKDAAGHDTLCPACVNSLGVLAQRVLV